MYEVFINLHRIDCAVQIEDEAVLVFVEGHVKLMLDTFARFRVGVK